MLANVIPMVLVAICSACIVNGLKAESMVGNG
jgi:hypothetical protein